MSFQVPKELYVSHSGMVDNRQGKVSCHEPFDFIPCGLLSLFSPLCIVSRLVLGTGIGGSDDALKEGENE